MTIYLDTTIRHFIKVHSTARDLVNYGFKVNEKSLKTEKRRKQYHKIESKQTLRGLECIPYVSLEYSPKLLQLN